MNILPQQICLNLHIFHYDLIRNVNYRSFIQNTSKKIFFTLNFFLKRQTCKHSVHLKGVCFLLGNFIFVIYDTYQVIVQGIQCFNICSLYLFSFIYTDIVMVFFCDHFFSFQTHLTLVCLFILTHFDKKTCRKCKFDMTSIREIIFYFKMYM